ncbi:phosphopantothenoylcysteine decarboxylase/phosphopantothenate--cysteine ligase [Natronobacillus azotifigens]|uniref:Coenzyme A biosynthesis bifunctional protein CoaBC n=1 Tax=Natronobacillus azotifigens TaxID=472978 RepID=A0A9J6RCF5_9BACI|nr:bifunctional phosphopantothenoylcysteine decarboxylase/phosphopantothenate--cysteine ligase CoaBC [Natronobacillus azotifigens]MCZ0703376.1 bifunctional phosphopantothenoylcysteine decarboxylase/phosphopantothenate--cysteine ligase CoaBC [Natronobacillus azotifigens]
MLAGKRIVLGVTGGIAAYKAIALTSKLVQKGAEVKVIMTESAKKFVTPLSFQAISRNAVYEDTFDEKDDKRIAHIDLADWADFFILAPATANIIGKIANGIADDMLSTTLMATQADVYLAPAMNVHMYQHPAVQKNLNTLASWGFLFIEPGEGYLACGYVGKGRLEEPETIISTLESSLSKKQMLKGKRILISAGPTQEKIDPVRYFTNHSSGKMGYAIAEVAAQLGAQVTLVSGPVSLETPPNVNRIDVTTAAEMYQVINSHFEDSEIIIKAAAVADYRPKQTVDQKMKKKDGELSITLERTNDILQSLGDHKTNQYLVGFAAETHDVLEFGTEKLKKKNLDAIVINDLTKPGAGFGVDTNEVTLLTRTEKKFTFPVASKKQIAQQILNEVAIDLGEQGK